MSANKLKSPLQIEEEVAEKIKQKQQQPKKQPVKPLSENALREPVAEKADKKEAIASVVPAEETKAKRKPANASRKLIKMMNVFGFFERNQIVNAMPFILFVTCLILFYIANSYYAEGVVRDIDKIKVDLKERRAEYISTMSRLMYESKQSEVAKSLLPTGIKESTNPAHKIFMNTKVDQKKHTDGN